MAEQDQIFDPELGEERDKFPGEQDLDPDANQPAIIRISNELGAKYDELARQIQGDSRATPDVIAAVILAGRIARDGKIKEILAELKTNPATVLGGIFKRASEANNVTLSFNNPLVAINSSVDRLKKLYQQVIDAAELNGTSPQSPIEYFNNNSQALGIDPFLIKSQVQISPILSQYQYTVLEGLGIIPEASATAVDRLLEAVIEARRGRSPDDKSIPSFSNNFGLETTISDLKPKVPSLDAFRVQLKKSNNGITFIGVGTNNLATLQAIVRKEFIPFTQPGVELRR